MMHQVAAASGPNEVAHSPLFCTQFSPYHTHPTLQRKDSQKRVQRNNTQRFGHQRHHSAIDVLATTVATATAIRFGAGKYHRSLSLSLSLSVTLSVLRCCCSCSSSSSSSCCSCFDVVLGQMSRVVLRYWAERGSGCRV
jgi:hypothetical protein